MERNDREFIVQKIRAQYTEKETTGLEELKALDRQAKRPANVFAWSFGTVSALVMGSGMSLIMTEVGALLGLTATMVPGVVIGVVGLGMALANYPIYKKLLAKGRKAYGQRILQLSQQILEEA